MPAKEWSSPPRQIESAVRSQKGDGQVPVVRLMNRSGLTARRSSIKAMAAAKSLSKALPGVTLSGLPVPSSLNWLMP